MVTLIRSDLEFILAQIKISEAHAAGQSLTSLIPNAELPWGVRTVDGSFNNLLPGQTGFGAADRTFPRLLTASFRNEGDDAPFLGVSNNNYALTGPVAGNVVDADPRIISNLIVDQSFNNPAALDAASAFGFPEIQVSPGRDGVFGTADDVNLNFIANRAPDEGLSAPFNSWMTLFGQFFDHGLDLVTKGGNGMVVVPLQPDDPLYVPGSPTNFMVVTRATLFGGEARNTTTPFVDQNQTYTSHASHQVFHREYIMVGGHPVATGRLLNGPEGGLATWADVKQQARDLLGIELDDLDVLDAPLLVTDLYGNFIPDPITGFPQIVVDAGPPPVTMSGTPGAPVDASLALRTGHSFLDDIAHNAAPGTTFDHDNNPGTPNIVVSADADNVVGNAIATDSRGNKVAYDNELLDKHYITGDGRGNENIGLTAVHHVFHSEHNRMVQQVKDIVLASNDPAFIAEWVRPGANIADGVQDDEWNGERLFQTAKFTTEMQYQHLVFEEFARKVQPLVDVFVDYDSSLDPAIVAEFAHTVYRFGHSMLTETIDRYDPNWNVIDAQPGTPGDQQIGLIAAFLNPVEFANGGPADQAAGAIVRGMTRQVGNEIDEFITEALRNNLVGLPLDLAAVNIARGRSEGVPSLNAARREFFTATGDTLLKPYTSWVDFALSAKNPTSVINFIAAYGTHSLVTAETTLEGKRAAAMAIVTGADQQVFGDPSTTADDRTISAPTDRLDFLNSTGAWANQANGVTISGVDDIDFWIGGLAERKMPFGGMLGSTFNFVFEVQLESLQNGDRFYYLSRTANMNFAAQLENNKFSEIIHRNTDAIHLPGDVFSTPDFFLEVDQSRQFNASEGGNADPLGGNIFFPLVIRGPNNFLQFTGGEHVVLGGTDQNDTIIGGDGDDTIWGDDGDDRLEGGGGFDLIFGGDGNDIITDAHFDDEIRSGAGDDVVHGGQGLDLLITDTGRDFVMGGMDDDEILAGQDDDFLSGGDGSDFLIGGEGSDWIEQNSGNGTLLGDNGDLVQGLPIKIGVGNPLGGDDVLYGGTFGASGNTDHDAEAGDDIMVGAVFGTDRFFGAQGFDWATHFQDPLGIVADMNVRLFDPPPVAGSPGAILDRYSTTEGLSGTHHSDILRGDDAFLGGGGGEAEGVAGSDILFNIDLIDGLRAFLPAGSTFFDGGNIIFGGDGSDIIEGRGGNDLIDGDRWLNVRISVRDILDPSFELFSVQTMSQIQDQMISGAIKVAQLQIVREVLMADGFDDTDTAAFSDVRDNYIIEGDGLDVDGDGFISISHIDAAGVVGAGADGVDRVKNIERLQFADQTVVIAGNNAGPVGRPTIAGVPIEDGVLTASSLGVTDPDNPDGVITGIIGYTWQVELVAGSNTFTDILRIVADNEVRVQGSTFVPDDAEVGLRVRVLMSYIDATGVIETVASLPTAPVINVNDAPIGNVTISDLTPTEGQLLSAQRNFSDADGIAGAVFTYQWQSSVDGLTWTNIAGATTELFQPAAAQRGQMLRVSVSYTDDGGTLESPATNPNLVSAPTFPVGSLLVGNNQANVISGTAFDDNIMGLGGADTLAGLGGDDTIDGGNGADTVFGGDGNDTLLGGGGGDLLFGDAGNDTLNGGAGGDSLNGGDGNDSFVYNFGDGSDAMDGGAGNDTVNVTGTTGDDVLDVVFDGTAISVLEGGSLVNIERVNANLLAGRDTLSFAATVAAVGVAVNLSIGTASGFGSVLGVENVIGGSGDDDIAGNSGANRIDGGRGNDFLEGLAGDDVIVASLSDGNDDIDGGLGFDIYDLSGTTAAATVDLGAGTSQSAQTGLDTLNNIESVIGTIFDDQITGDAKANVIDGGRGADVIMGGAGDDILSGGPGSDIVIGGDGNDTIMYTFGDGTDLLLDGGPGVDSLAINGTVGNNSLVLIYSGGAVSSFNGTAIANIEAINVDLLDGTDTISYAGTTAISPVTVDLAQGIASGVASLANVENITGGAGDDFLIGDSGDNTINGAAGADQITGGDGNDTMNGGAGNDRFIFAPGFGDDVINGFDANPNGGQDLLDISSLGITAGTFAANVAIAAQGANTLITISGETILLNGVASNTVTSQDFILA